MPVAQGMTEPPSDAGALFVAVAVHYLHDRGARAAAMVAGGPPARRPLGVRYQVLRVPGLAGADNCPVTLDVPGAGSVERGRRPTSRQSGCPRPSTRHLPRMGRILAQLMRPSGKQAFRYGTASHSAGRTNHSRTFHHRPASSQHLLRHLGARAQPDYPVTDNRCEDANRTTGH